MSFARRAFVLAGVLALALALSGCEKTVTGAGTSTALPSGESTSAASRSTSASATSSSPASQAPAPAAVSTTPPTGSSGSKKSSGSWNSADTAALVVVPDFKGMYQSDAGEKMVSLGLKYAEKVNAEGLGPKGGVSVAQVYKQVPAAGTKVKRGTTVTIYYQVYE